MTDPEIEDSAQNILDCEYLKDHESTYKLNYHKNPALTQDSW